MRCREENRPWKSSNVSLLLKRGLCRVLPNKGGNFTNQMQGRPSYCVKLLVPPFTMCQYNNVHPNCKICIQISRVASPRAFMCDHFNFLPCLLQQVVISFWRQCRKARTNKTTKQNNRYFLSNLKSLFHIYSGQFI